MQKWSAQGRGVTRVVVARRIARQRTEEDGRESGGRWKVKVESGEPVVAPMGKLEPEER